MVDITHRIIQGDCLQVMQQMPPNSFEAIITDPPYASGGLHAADRVKPPSEKYSSYEKGDLAYAGIEWANDTMDQLTWIHWISTRLKAARDITTTGGVCAVFIDWRQIAALYDALGQAGWIIRGLLAWDKRNARPQPCRPRQQCEFVVWASNGALSTKRNAQYLPGLFSITPPAAAVRLHQTQKPLELMRQLVHICEEGGRICDPFCGSGTTVRAALLEGYQAIGIEQTKHYVDVARGLLRDLEVSM